MKKHINKVIIFIMVFVMALSATFITDNVYASAKTVKVTGTYYQSDARKMKKMINSFRTGDEAWYYDINEKKVYLSGLGKLKYDYTLEKVAMKRAAEISYYFSHTRPNGESCFTLYPEGYTLMGENIAMGTSSIMGVKDTFEIWKETNYSYSGQGHRRNMLDEGFTCVGIACFEVDGCKYWVQEFGSPKSSKAKTKACNKKKTVKISVI